jgi:hypothetical protein
MLSHNYSNDFYETITELRNEITTLNDTVEGDYARLLAPVVTLQWFQNALGDRLDYLELNNVGKSNYCNPVYSVPAVYPGLSSIPVQYGQYPNLMATRKV